MVACPHALASAAGAAALRAGGSAVDAALAAGSTLGVIYPHMCGIRGADLLPIYDTEARKVHYLDGGGRAAASVSGFNESAIPFRGIAPATLTTPGAVASFCEAHSRFGRLPLSRCFEQAIHFARGGWPVSERVQAWIRKTADELANDPVSAQLF